VKAPTRSYEELVASIADVLRPWRDGIDEQQALAEIRVSIRDMLQHEPDVIWPPELGPEIGYRGDNKRHAENILDAINRLNDLLSKRWTQFVWSLTWTLTAERSAAKEEKIVELRERLQRLSEDCGKIIQNPPGVDPRMGYRQITVANVAFWLMIDVSSKRPAAGHSESAYCLAASLLFEAVTGEADRDLQRACKRRLTGAM